MVAGATWAASTLVLQDNRLNLLLGEVESQKTVAEQYKSKVELLQRELDNLRSENVEYRTWLSQTKDAIPVMVPRLTELKAKVDALEAEKKEIRKSSPELVRASEANSKAGHGLFG